MSAQERPAASSLTPFTFSGTYEDDSGAESITWTVLPTTRRSKPGQSGFELRTEIRGVKYWGYDIDGLEAEDPVAARQKGLPEDISNGRPSRLTGSLPCWVGDGVRRARVIDFELVLKVPFQEPKPDVLTLSLQRNGQAFTAVAEWFEDAMAKLGASLPDGVRLVCCFTCAYSDYSPGGHGLCGMSCHRGAKRQYLAVHSVGDYWSVPVTEEVMETHLCDQYEARVAGTGYRG